jgi:hypothetical protein
MEPILLKSNDGCSASAKNLHERQHRFAYLKYNQPTSIFGPSEVGMFSTREAKRANRTFVSTVFPAGYS